MLIRDEDAATYKLVRKRTLTEGDILAEAEQILRRRMERQGTLSSPQESAAFLRMRLAHMESEHFTAIWLDNRHRVVAIETLFTGTLDGASVYPREVVRSALAHNAAAVIFSHNHPSGLPEPSAADVAITRTLKQALDLIGVRMLDHIVVGTEGTVSLAARGLC